MKKIFIQNTGALANGAATDPSGVAAGKIAVFDVATGAEHSFEDTAMPAQFYIVQGHATTPVISAIINSADVAKVVYTAYVAPVKKVITVSAIPVGPAGGDTYSLKVVNLKSDSEPFKRKTYEVQVAASASANSIATALAAAVNADPNRFVNASLSTDDVVLTSVDFEDNFQVFLEDVTGLGLSAATVTVTTAFKEGSGSAVQLYDEEISNAGTVGNYYRDTTYPLMPETFTDTATPGTYDRYDILIKTNQDGQIPVKANEFYQVVIAHKVAVTGDFDTFFGI